MTLTNFVRAKKFADEVIVDGVPKKLTSFEDLNERFALLEAPGLPSMYINRRDVMPLTDRDLKRRLEADVVENGKDKNGKTVYMPAHRFWIGHGRRHAYRQIVFTSRETGTDCLNLYRGLGIAPKPGECNRILAHAHDVICAKNDKVFNALLDLQAVANPTYRQTVKNHSRRQEQTAANRERNLSRKNHAAHIRRKRVDAIKGRTSPRPVQ
jgi:hypothetical protein